MEPGNIEHVYIKIMNAGYIGDQEVGRVVVTVNEIYETFFKPKGICYNVGKELRVSTKVTFTKNDTPCELRESAKAFEVQFADFRGPAYLWMGFLPANEAATNYCKSIYSMGGIGSYFNCLRSDVGGVGRSDDFEMSEYRDFSNAMESQSFAP